MEHILNLLKKKTKQITRQNIPNYCLANSLTPIKVLALVIEQKCFPSLLKTIDLKQFKRMLQFLIRTHNCHRTCKSFGAVSKLNHTMLLFHYRTEQRRKLFREYGHGHSQPVILITSSSEFAGLLPDAAAAWPSSTIPYTIVPAVVPSCNSRMSSRFSVGINLFN